MLIPLPFNDSVVIRLFEPTEMTHSCARGMDILGVSYDEDKYRDAVGVTVSSSLNTEEGRCKAINLGKDITNSVAVPLPILATLPVATPTIFAVLMPLLFATVFANEVTKRM